MANTRSAKKRARQAPKRQARNASVRNAVKTAVRKAREAFASKDKKQAEAALKFATKTLDRAASSGVLHAKNAARRISRLASAAASIK